MEEESAHVGPAVRVVLKSGQTMETLGEEAGVSSLAELKKRVKTLTGAEDMVMARGDGRGGLVEMKGEDDGGEGGSGGEGGDFFSEEGIVFLFPRKVWNAWEMVERKDVDVDAKRRALEGMGMVDDDREFLRQLELAKKLSLQGDRNRESARERLRTRAAFLGLEENKDIDATGDCQFDAAADQLRRDLGLGEETKESVRRKVVDWIEKNENRDLGHGMTLRQWVENTIGKGWANWTGIIGL